MPHLPCPRKSPKAVVPKLEASAKASLKAEYSRKKNINKNITQNIPEDVTREKAGAWLDLISPFTRWAGLKGDALQHKREILRLQQEETLAVIALKMRQRLSKEAGRLSPIPLKFMVPFLE